MHQSTQAASSRWVMLVPIIGLLVAMARGATDQEQRKLQLAYTTARMAVDAFVKGDYQKVIDLSYPKAVEIEGGREKEIASMRDTVSRAKAEGLTCTAVHLENPTKLSEDNKRLFTIVPEAVIISGPNATMMTQHSYLLAISDDDGKSWKLIDGGTVSHQRIKQLFPHLPEDLELPGDPKPAPGAMLTTADGRLQLQLPDGWEKDDADPSPAEMSAHDPATGATCMITWAEKSGDTDLAKYAQSLKDEVQSAIKDLHSTDPKDARIGGHRAIRYEFTGKAHGVSCGLVLIALETDSRFSGIFVKCELSQFDAHKADFSKLPEGLTETAAKP